MDEVGTYVRIRSFLLTFETALQTNSQIPGRLEAMGATIGAAERFSSKVLEMV
jgi:hypothetical protein